jgi:hypothetical protein
VDHENANFLIGPQKHRCYGHFLQSTDFRRDGLLGNSAFSARALPAAKRRRDAEKQQWKIFHREAEIDLSARSPGQKRANHFSRKVGRSLEGEERTRDAPSILADDPCLGSALNARARLSEAELLLQ